MNAVVLVGCGKSKLDHAAPARELYTGNLFRASLRYGESLAAAAPGAVVYIASALHGLLELDRVVEPYERTLQGMPRDVCDAWAGGVVALVKGRHPTARDLIVLAGAVYARPLRDTASRRGLVVAEPLQGLAIGERLARLKAWNQAACKACEHRRSRGFDGQCPACAAERARSELAAERAVAP